MSAAAQDEIDSLRARVAALEQLLEVHERTTVEQAERLEQALRDVEAERARLQELIRNSPAVMAVYHGPEDVITAVNPAWERIVGKAGVVGKPFREAFPEFAESGLFELLEAVRRTGEPYVGTEVRVPLERRDGVVEDTCWNFVWQPLRSADGAVEDILVHAVEVTEQVRARDEVEARSEEMARLARSLARSNRELEQFAYIAAHDLKSPLRGIANLSEWIEEDLAGAMNPTTQRQMELLRGRVHRMEELIDGIREYTRAGSEGADAEEVDTADLVGELGRILVLPDESALEVSADLPTLRTHRSALRQVFFHLLDNARKHGSPAEGGVRIRVEARREGSLWEFRIEDNGPGIPPQYRAKAWTIFQTLRRRDHFEGAGIGLPLVRKIVEQHGGSVGIETAPEGGTIVRFTWAARTR